MVIALMTVGYVLISATVYLGRNQRCSEVLFLPGEAPGKEDLPVETLQPEVHVRADILATYEEAGVRKLVSQQVSCAN